MTTKDAPGHDQARMDRMLDELLIHPGRPRPHYLDDPARLQRLAAVTQEGDSVTIKTRVGALQCRLSPGELAQLVSQDHGRFDLCLVRDNDAQRAASLILHGAIEGGIPALGLSGSAEWVRVDPYDKQLCVGVGVWVDDFTKPLVGRTGDRVPQLDAVRMMIVRAAIDCLINEAGITVHTASHQEVTGG